jgi:hypothetical protein
MALTASSLAFCALMYRKKLPMCDDIHPLLDYEPQQGKDMVKFSLF